MKKKIIITLFSLLLVIGVAGTFWGPSIAEAASDIWNSCTRGKVDCPYPGDCRSYIDTNNDLICDRSQSDPQLISSPATAENSPDDSMIITAADDMKAGSNEIESNTPDVTATDTGSTSAINRSYYLIPVLLIIVILYSLTWILSARKSITIKLHRKIWNVVLLVSAVISAFLGLILILNIDFGTDISLPFNMLFWHVEAGIALGVISLFHIFWHWRYFMKILKITNNAC